MPVETPTSINQFQQLRNRQNDLYRKNTAAIIEASKKSDRATVDELKRERLKLAKNDEKIFVAERAFQASDLSQSEAEKRLVRQTKKANDLVRGVNSLKKVLESATKMAAILTRLIALLS